MKKILMIALIAIIPAMAFADFQIGAVGMYKGDPATIQVSGIGLDDFTFGGEARLKFLGFLQGGLTALYYPGETYSSIVALADIGVSLDIAFLRLGIGLGPNFTVSPSDLAARPVSMGANLKMSADVNIGRFSVGLVGFYTLQSFADFANIGDVFTSLPWLGVCAMFKLF